MTYVFVCPAVGFLPLAMIGVLGLDPAQLSFQRDGNINPHKLALTL